MKHALATALLVAATFAGVAVNRELTATAAQSCESLASLELQKTTVTLAQVVPVGGFSRAIVGPSAAEQGFSNPVAFCRVAATLSPSSDSDIKVEVWMPTSGWNGKFQAVGNGGWAGSINYPAMIEALGRGYATSSTDTGHVGGSPGSFALGHPEKLTDFAYRSVHEMTFTAKVIIDNFYGSAPKLSYWNGCSAGGRQGLSEAARFPADYDGIIAGAPANPLTRGYAAWALWVGHATLKDPSSYIPPAKYPMIHDAVIGACDTLDGLRDGLIDDPTRCKFDPQVLACKGEDDRTCLTAPQVLAARKILSPATSPRSTEEIFPGMMPGTELRWGGFAGGPEPMGPAVGLFKYVVFKNPNWDWRTLDFDRDVAAADRTSLIEPLNPDITRFVQQGGKLLMYHGWADQTVAPLSTVKFYERVQTALGGVSNTSNAVRLFMAPGMSHCRGGEGPNIFDTVDAIERWVEEGKAPDMIIASHNTDGRVDRTRPLCPYPQVAGHTGTNSTDEAANFICKAP